jgi:uncharacterized membrane protein YccC
MPDERSMLSFGVIDLYLLSLAFDPVWSVSGARLVSGARTAVPDWLSDVVPEWLTEVMRPKKAPVPWGTMARAVLALWVPMAVGFATGRRELGLLPAMGGLLSIMIDNGGPFWSRVERIGTAAVLGGAPGLFVGTLIHGRGWIAVLAIVVVAGVSSILARLGGLGSVTGLQLFIYSALGLGPLGALRPWWHTALQFLVGVAWALLLITPGYLLSPRSAERKAVAEVYHALARDLRLIGTPGAAGAHAALASALNAAYDTTLATRASMGGRSKRSMHLVALLNLSHQFAEANAALRATGERVPPLVTEEIDKFGDAIVAEHGPGSGPLGFGGRRAGGGPPVPVIPPPWSSSPGALALRDAMVNFVRVLSGNWTPAVAVPDDPADHLWLARLRARAAAVIDQLIGGRIAWEFTIRLMLCTGVAAVASEVLPLARSYWLVLTVGIIMKPDFGSVFARAVQRGVGTVVGAVLGAVILALVPYGPWLLLPFGVLAALLPYAKARNFGLVATFLTPLVVLLIDLLDVGGWHLAEARLVDTALASVVVLVFGYAPWPSAWQAHLPGQFAETVRTICAYMDEALVTMPAERIEATGSAKSPKRAPGEAPGVRSRLRRGAYQSLSNLRAEFQRTMSEPAAVSRRATAWYPAVVALEEVMDTVTATVVAIERGAPAPSAASVHALTGTLRAVADAIETLTPPRLVEPLPTDPALEAVTASVRSVLSVLIKGGEELSPSGLPSAQPERGREALDSWRYGL